MNASHHDCSRLAEPGRIGPLHMKNRIVMGPMGTNYGTTDGLPTERDKLYYAERARGGCAMILTEAMNIAAGARNHNNSLCVFHDRFIPGLAALVEAINDAGSHAVAQLNHRGQLLRRSVLGMEPVGPMDGTHPFTKEPVRGIDKAGIRTIQQDFVDSARRIYHAGYDACEIHAANGYLFQQFFTERFNKRTDEYGGTLENRMRLLLETVDMIQTAVPNLPLMVRISALEFADGGYSIEEAIELAKVLERMGIIALDLSGGSNEHPSLSRYCIQPPSFPRACLSEYSKPFRKALEIPVIMAGRIIAPEDAETALAEGAADYISVGRGLIADPHWAAKALGQVKAPIRQCISCNVCFERLTLEKDVCCVVNPFVGTEFEALEHLEPHLSDKMNEVGSGLRVLVLGAGMSGTEAARVASAMGAEVALWERQSRPGGQIDLALAAPDKEDVTGAWDYRLRSLEALGVRIETDVEATEERIRAFAPDCVVIATGSNPRPLPAAGTLGLPIHQAWDVLRDPALIPEGAQVTVIGGGLVGLETIDLLVERDRIAGATVIEMRESVAPEMARNNRYEIIQRLAGHGIRIETEVQMNGTQDGKLLLRRGDQELTVPLGDIVIVAIGAQPNRSVLEAVEGAGCQHILVGDANIPGDFMSAIRDAALSTMGSLRVARVTTPQATTA